MIGLASHTELQKCFKVELLRKVKKGSALFLKKLRRRVVYYSSLQWMEE